MEKRQSPLTILAIVTLAIFTIFITWRAKALETKLARRVEQSEMVGRRAPDFSLESLNGQKVSLADFRGKKMVVVSFWASWCGPCRMEMPALRDYYKKNQEHWDDFEVVAIDTNDERSEAATFALSERLPFPVVLDPSGTISDLYGVQAIPAMFIVGKDGIVKYAQIGFDPTMEIELSMNLGIKIATPGQTTSDDNTSH
jgi:peroxiredoxin